jgi:hypothetical protein
MPTTVSENAVPVGLTAFCLSIAVLFIVGIALVILPARTRSAPRLPLLAGVLLLATSSMVTVQNLRALGSMDRTPAPLPLDSIVGFWTEGNATVQLRSDATRLCSHTPWYPSPCTRSHARTRWSRRGDHTIIFAAGDTLIYQIVRFDGSLYLLGPETPRGGTAGLAYRRGMGPYPVYDPESP